MDNGTDRSVVSMLNVLNLVMELWLYESVVLRKHTEILCIYRYREG